MNLIMLISNQHPRTHVRAFLHDSVHTLTVPLPHGPEPRLASKIPAAEFTTSVGI